MKRTIEKPGSCSPVNKLHLSLHFVWRSNNLRALLLLSGIVCAGAYVPRYWKHFSRWRISAYHPDLNELSFSFPLLEPTCKFWMKLLNFEAPMGNASGDENRPMHCLIHKLEVDLHLRPHKTVGNNVRAIHTHDVCICRSDNLQTRQLIIMLHWILHLVRHHWSL